MTAAAGIGRLLVNMPGDLEISSRIFWQLREILGDNFALLRLDESRNEAFTNSILDTMLKLHAMRHHLKNFEALELQYLASVKASSDGIFRTHRMLFEFEAFLFQLKSTLDVAVKVLGVLFPGRFSVKTFKGKGETLCKGLEQFKRDKSVKTEPADDLIKILRDDRDSWLEHAISLRDTIGHYKTLADFNYHAVNHGDTRTIKKPVIAGTTPQDYLNLTYQNCIEFVQDFICMSIVLYLPAQFYLVNGAPRVGEPVAQYIKFGLGITAQAKG